MPTASRTAAIVLAAGKSERMGRSKMLLPFGDRPMVARTIEMLLQAGDIDPIIVVTGNNEQEIRAATGEYAGIVHAHNSDFARGGMLSSVQTGLGALPDSCDAFLIVLGDQPMVLPDTVSALMAAWHPASAPIVLPSYRGERGHPVMISGAFAPEILTLGGADTPKTLLIRNAGQVRELPLDDEATVQDIDTPLDYATALQRWRERGAGS